MPPRRPTPHPRVRRPAALALHPYIRRTYTDPLATIAEQERQQTDEQREDVPLVEVISRDPDYLSGWPRFPHSRVPIRALIDTLIAGESIDEFLLDFPGITREQAVNVLRLACKELDIVSNTGRTPDREERVGSDYLEDTEKW